MSIIRSGAKLLLLLFDFWRVSVKHDYLRQSLQAFGLFTLLALVYSQFCVVTGLVGLSLSVSSVWVRLARSVVVV